MVRVRLDLGPKRVLSLPDAVASVLMEEFFKADQPQQLGLPIAEIAESTTQAQPDTVVMNGSLSGADMCPECGTISLIRAEGCRKCLTCGYSEC